MRLRLALTTLLFLLTAPAFAFPTNGVLDTFTGTDNTSPPNANWTNNVISAVAMDLEDNAATTHVNTGFGQAYWNPTTFPADQEAYITIVDTSGNYYCVYLRINTPGVGTATGYEVCVADSSAGADAHTMQIYRVTASSEIKQGANIAQTIVQGESFGATAIGNQICGWYKTLAGSWTNIGCRTDSTYSGSGRIGMACDGDTTIGHMDNFGGGSLAAAAGGGQKQRHKIPF